MLENMYIITAYLLKSETKYKVLNTEATTDKNGILFLSQLGFQLKPYINAYGCNSPSYDKIKACLESLTINIHEIRQQRVGFIKGYNIHDPSQNSIRKWKCITCHFMNIMSDHICAECHSMRYYPPGTSAKRTWTNTSIHARNPARHHQQLNDGQTYGINYSAGLSVPNISTHSRIPVRHHQLNSRQALPININGRHSNINSHGRIPLRNHQQSTNHQTLYGFGEIYSNRTAIDKPDYINMVHPNTSQPFHNILNRIETVQKQHEERLIFWRQRIERIVYNYCCIVKMSFDVMQLIIRFYVNVKFKCIL